jgi:hypothetical protein
VPGERIAVRAERGTDGLVNVGGPLGDRGERPRAGQHRRGGHCQDRDQWVSTAGPSSWVANRGKVGEQVWGLSRSERISLSQDGQAQRDRR